MSNIYPPTPTPAGSTSGSGGTTDAAKEQASQVAGDVAAAGQNVLGTAKEQASNVAGEAKTQAKDLLKQTQGELREQAGAQQERVANGLRSLSDELGSMAQNSTGGGIASDLVQQASSRAGGIASWLDDRDPGALLEEVKTFARNRPGTFIGIAAVAGIVAGRLTKSLTSVAADEKDATTSASPSSPATATAPVTNAVPTTGPASAAPIAFEPASTVPPVPPVADVGRPAFTDTPVYDGAAGTQPPLTSGSGDPLADNDPFFRDPRA